MFWKKKTDWTQVAPSSPSAIRIGVAALNGYQNLIVLPSEPAAKDFQERIEQISEGVQTAQQGEFDFERLADELETTVKSFSDRQQKSLERSLEAVYDSMREVWVSMDGAVHTSNDLEDAATGTQERLAKLKEHQNYEVLIKGISQEIASLSKAIETHKADAKLIRKVCASQIEELRTRVRSAEQAVKTDYLTKLHNRASFDFLLNAAVSRISIGEEATLAVLDINKFKKINDTYGHLAGDTVLSEFADKLQQAFGKSTVHIARIGGDEFAVIFKGNEIICRAKLERLNSLLEVTPIKHQTHEITVQASFGIIQLTSGHTKDSAISDADAQMYQHKRAA